MEFEDKIVIVTGAASGIGRAAALMFADRGAKVVVADLNLLGAQETAMMIGAKAIAVQVDVSDEHACEAMVATTIDAFGKLDILFNNAGIANDRGHVGEQPTADWRRVIDVNLNGVYYCTRAALPEMLKNGAGVIVNTASVDGQVGMATLAPYCAAKHGVIGLTKVCALEYGSRNIRCVAVAPGYVETAMVKGAFTDVETAGLIAITPLRRACMPKEVAELVTWLASDKASFVNGSTHTIDGGLTSGFIDMRQL